MNKLTKLGVSALCGSLAAISSANAGEMTVTGGVDMSWISLDDETTGSPLGVGSNMTFSGSGELDNGWGVALSIAINNKNVYSNTNVTVTVPSMGDVHVSQGVSGTGIDRFDDVTPTVWEEAYGTGLGTGIDTVAGNSAGSTIEYIPNMLPEGLSAYAAWTPNAAGSGSSDKGSSGDDNSVKGSGWDLAISATDALLPVPGLTIYAGMSETAQETTSAGFNGDKEEMTWAIKYAMGGFTVGYQYSDEDLGTATGALGYENVAYGITFNVNDNLSVGYNNYESEQDNDTDVTAEAQSLQVAYTMGGATIRLAEAEIDNAKYQTGAAYNREATTLSVSLAF